MDDLSSTISQILSDPAKMQQIQAIASSLGLGAENTAPVPAPAPVVAPSAGGELDLSALSNLLGGLVGNSGGTTTPAQSAAAPAGLPDLSGLLSSLGGASGQQAGGSSGTPDLSKLLSGLGGGTSGQQAANGSGTPDLSGLLSGLGGNSGGGTPDLSALSGLLGGLAGGGQKAPAAPASNGFDVASLAQILRTGNPPAEEGASSGGGFDLSMLMKLQQAMANVQTNRANIDLLLALKPRLSERRAKKVDDAIRVMQVVQFLPLLKESGLFGEMDNILGSLGAGFGNVLGGLGSGGSGGSRGGGLSSLLGGLGGNIGGILNALTGRR